MLDASKGINAYISSTGILVEDSSKSNFLTDYIAIKNNQNYTLSLDLTVSQFALNYYDINKNFIERNVVSAVRKTTFSHATAKYVRCVAYQSSYQFTPENMVNTYHFQLEKGTTPTNYVEHKEQTFTFPLGNEKLMLGDYLADDGIHKNRKKIVLDGTSENKFSSFSTGANNRGAIAAFSDIKKGVDFGYNTALCTNFAYVPNVYFDSGDTEGFIVDSTGTIYVRFGSQSEINTLAKANQWLANTLPELEYELAEETIIPYTPAQQEVYNQIKQAISYEEQTNISSNQNAIFSVEAYQSTKLILQNISNAIVALGGV